MARDIYQEVTNSIIASLEAGVRPWAPRWHGASNLPRRSCGKPYQGINVPILWGSASAKGYMSAYWLTYKQAESLGAHVRKGERGTAIVFASTFLKRGKDDTGAESVESVPFLKSYSVFNADQIDDLPEMYRAKPADLTAVAEAGRIPAAEAVVAATGATIVHGGGRAFYQLSEDLIRLPDFAAFFTPADYYATAFHELGHWTGAERRINRTFGKRFGDKAYAAEELVAEMAAAFIAAHVGLSAEPRPDHASYVASWLSIMKGDKRAIFTAASAAQKAANFVLGAVASEEAEAA